MLDIKGQDLDSIENGLETQVDLVETSKTPEHVRDKKKSIVEEIADYLLLNDGPVVDENGRAKGHPTKKRLQCSDLEAAIELAESKGLAKGWKPYHFFNTISVWDNDKYVDEVLVKKINLLLEQKYNSDLVELIQKTSAEELINSPLVEILNGKKVEISINNVAKTLEYNMFKMIQKYIELNCLKGFENFKPYHMSKTSRGFYDDPRNVNEVLVKKIDQLLKDKYDGDLVELIHNTYAEELIKSPLVEILNGKEIEVPMGTISINKDSNTLFKMVQRYIEIKDLKGFENFRPYHMAKASHRTYNGAEGQKNTDEILVKKIEQLLKDKYNGDLVELIHNTNVEELINSPLVEILNGKSIEVPVSSVAVTQNCNTLYKMVKRYIEIKDLKGFENFMPYHMFHASNGFYNEQKNVNEVIVKKIEQLLQENYNGDLFELITNVTARDLKSPLKDKLMERTVEVSMGSIGIKFKSSTYEIIKHYFKLKGKPFLYTRSRFVGLPETRKRRITGELSKYDLKTIERSDKYDTSLFGFKAYTGKDKDVTRELITEYYIDKIGETDVSYLGLESEQFSSLKLFAQELNYDPTKSTVIEREEWVYNGMKSTQEHATNGMKRTLKGLEIILGHFDKEIEKLKHPYNLVNFDTCGHFSTDKARSLNTLFQKRLLDKQAVLYVTLDNSPLAKKRAKAIFNGAEQVGKLDEYVTQAAKSNGYEIKDKFSLDYEGGTNGNKRDMLILGFYVEKH